MSDDLENLQGAWTLASLELEGNPMPAAGGIRIHGDRFEAIGMGADYAGRVEIDAGKRPKRFDLVFTKGPEEGNRNRGIYRLDGDEWTICLNMSGKARPSAFATSAGSGNALEVFTRGATAPLTAGAEESAIAPAGEGELVGEWEMVAAWQEGYALDERMVKTGRRVTSATHTATWFGKQKYMEAAYTTDATGTPKTIDLASKGKTQLGIYEVEGDTMKICFAAPGRPRPTDFEARTGDGRTSAVWKRKTRA
jgi:uncharacterized protein (TIGR03067 family)